jgi:hypothetical protein
LEAKPNKLALNTPVCSDRLVSASRGRRSDGHSTRASSRAAGDPGCVPLASTNASSTRSMPHPALYDTAYSRHLSSSLAVLPTTLARIRSSSSSLSTGGAASIRAAVMPPTPPTVASGAAAGHAAGATMRSTTTTCPAASASSANPCR